MNKKNDLMCIVFITFKPYFIDNFKAIPRKNVVIVFLTYDITSTVLLKNQVCLCLETFLAPITHVLYKVPSNPLTFFQE